MTGTMHARVISLMVGLLTILASACAAQGGTTSTVPGAAERPAAAAKKTLTIADSYEPKWIVESYTTEFFPQGNNMKYLVHDNLIRTVQYQSYEPGLAAELPSIERGTWVVNADGTMQTIWKLRPNVKW